MANESLVGKRFDRWTVTGVAPRGILLTRCDCGAAGRVTITALRRRVSRSCGCLDRERRRRAFNSHRERFDTSYVPEPNTGCWLWAATTQSKGYGQHIAAGKRVGAHRYSYELHHGPIPPGLCVLHRCDTPACVNPAHLFAGTNAENARDRDAKGRNVRGSQVNTARLTPEQVAEIRRLHAAGDTAAELGRRFGVPPSHAKRVAVGLAWKCVA